jgi:hypothetical protein
MGSTYHGFCFQTLYNNVVHPKLCSIRPVATKSARDITEFDSVNMDA